MNHASERNRVKEFEPVSPEVNAVKRPKSSQGQRPRTEDEDDEADRKVAKRRREERGVKLKGDTDNT